MKILICISNVPDTTTKIKFVNNNTTFDKSGVQWIINPWDELALTRVLDLKDAQAGIESVTVMNVGLADAEPTIRKALAIGADKAIRINADPVDSFQVASLLADAIKKDPYDIVLCGIESCDYNGASVGGMLAELLDMPSVSAISFLNIAGGKVELKREIDGGQESIEIATPFVGIVQKGIAKDPRIPNMRGIMMAKTKPLQVLEPSAANTLTSVGSFDLPKAKAACKKIDPDNVKELVRLLHYEAKLI
ncbi:MAG: Electron transfer flavoprotein subunit beta [Bacteroidetes bacterium ADurb.Bin408]|nr:MAG: Electron transfer flavoprotein subunit beta [Bacteroidetes bacterium ADurb.Bin408]